MQFDIQIRRTAKTRDIPDIAAGPGLTDRQILTYGHHLAKITHGAVANLQGRPEGRLILVRATTTPADEGKSTSTAGLGDALNRIGRRATICIQEASAGPSFGM
nr:formate--tetrahydrofolate ligase [Paracoccus rhizosphaerae]